MTVKRIMRCIAILSLLLSIVLFLSLNIHIEKDPSLFSLLENQDVVSTFHRLSVFYIPGACLIGGLFALVFTTRKILVFMAICQLFVCFLLKTYIGESVYMLTLLIIYTVMSLVYLIDALLYKSETKKSR